MSRHPALWIEVATAFVSGWLLGMGLAWLAEALPAVGIGLMILIGLIVVGSIGMALMSKLIRPIGWLGHRLAGTHRPEGAVWPAHLAPGFGFGAAIALWFWFWPESRWGKT